MRNKSRGILKTNCPQKADNPEKTYTNQSTNLVTALNITRQKDRS